jgi:hypothetical protein
MVNFIKRAPFGHRSFRLASLLKRSNLLVFKSHSNVLVNHPIVDLRTCFWQVRTEATILDSVSILTVVWLSTHEFDPCRPDSVCNGSIRIMPSGFV